MPDLILAKILSGLNEAQSATVTSPPHGQIQVIAGPGTGKTKVLTSRVAFLMLRYKLNPEDIIVTTFTKKAANEMKERLGRMLEGSGIKVERLLMGTFHSICVRILKRFGYLIDLVQFKVAAERDASDIVKSVIAVSEDELHELRKIDQAGREDTNVIERKPQEFDSKFVRKEISSLKSRGIRPFEYKSDPKHSKTMLLLYSRYQEKLQLLKLLDFDDLLMCTNVLLKENKVLKSIQYVLIDEFQDTNSIQLELMRSFARQNVHNPDNITVVGDPDQSIYAFRDAVVKNFAIMRGIYPMCHIIMLSENYRSTKHVLDFSETFMSQQKDRKSKSLNSQLEKSFPPVYTYCDSNFSEAEYIAKEITWIKNLPGLYKYSDFAILIRATYLSRAIESALIKERIPYTVVKGRAFWERKEVSLMIDFLRVIAHSNDTHALLRALSASISGVGAKAIQTLTNVLEDQLKLEIPTLASLKALAAGKINAARVPKTKIKEFLYMIDPVLKTYEYRTNRRDAILEVFDQIKGLPVFENLLKGEEEKEENLAEIRLQLRDFNPEEEDELFIAEEDTKNTLDAPTKESFLEKFITSVDLFLTAEPEEENSNGKVSISTIHAAKGLEWPVVFVPSLLDGVIPTVKVADDETVNEERRIFYVAATRAKNLLYLSSGPRKGIGQEESRFLDEKVRAVLTGKQVAFRVRTALKTLYEIAGVQAPEESALDVYCHNYQKDYTERVKTQKEKVLSEAQKSPSTHFALRKTETKIPIHGIHYFNNRYSNQAIQYSLQKAEKRIDMLSTATVTNGPTYSSAANLDANPPKKRKTLGVRRRRPGL